MIFSGVTPKFPRYTVRVFEEVFLLRPFRERAGGGFGFSET